jgi:hypothetical protein
MRTFARLRQLLATHEELTHRLELEWRRNEQEGRLQYVSETIQRLIEAPSPPEPSSVESKSRIGFPVAEDHHGPTE